MVGIPVLGGAPPLRLTMALVKKTPAPSPGLCLAMPRRCGTRVINCNHIFFIESDRYHGFHVTAIASKLLKRSIPAGYAAGFEFS
jgi:hypothetical protein